MFAVSTTIVSLFILALSQTVVASPCVAFDINGNLFAFGLGGKDWNAGAQNTWSTSTGAVDITTSGRPPFNGANTTCYLAQYFNAIYVLNGDSTNPSDIYLYDATAKSWSKQSVTTGTFDPTSFTTILDHDTNLFYAVSHGELYTLNMASMTAANTTAIAWNDVEKTPYPSGYNPVMAIAENHVHFLGVPGVPAGDADIYVIHYNYFQPAAQSYPSLNGGSLFPAMHGQATAFFQPNNAGVQQEFAFIPDDFSGTYVANVLTNTTQMLAAPSSKDIAATYFASITSLVQLNSNGAVSYLPYQQGNPSINAAATWSTVQPIAIAAPPGTSTTSHSTSGTASGSKPSFTGTTIGGQAASGAIHGSQVATGMVVAVCLAAIASLL